MSRRKEERTNKSKKLVIAGPCSVESEEQIHFLAGLLSDIKQVQVLRGGIWKARTRPGGFEGHGNIALKWLSEAGKAHNLLTATEVATPAHAEEALKQGIDILWIGSRSVGSPFVVEDLAESISGCRNRIMIKNPTSPDLSLWIGAIERFSLKNIPNIGVIHRGFSTNWKSEYRNEPKWEIALELKKVFPDIPVIVDPSHIGGKARLVEGISSYAMNLGFDGLMVEVHEDPGKALTDSLQQITPAALGNMLKKLQGKALRKPGKKLLETLRVREWMNDIALTHRLLTEAKAGLSVKTKSIKV